MKYPARSHQGARQRAPRRGRRAAAVLLGSVFAAVLLAFLHAAPAGAQDEMDRVVASVDGDPITLQDVRDYAHKRGVELPPDAVDTNAFREALRGTIDEHLFQQELKSVSGDVDDGMVDRYIKSVNAQNHITDKELQQALRANKVSYEEFRARAREQVEKMVLIQREVRGRITIPDDQIEAYYKSHHAEFMVKEERYRIAQILVATDEHGSADDAARARARARLIYGRITEGQNFADLAQKFSDDPSKTNGGDLGWFKPDELIDEVRIAVMKLTIGQVSPVVQTSHGFHILKLEDHERPGLRPLAEVKSQIEGELTMQRLEFEFKRWLHDDLVKKHVIESDLSK